MILMKRNVDLNCWKTKDVIIFLSRCGEWFIMTTIYLIRHSKPLKVNNEYTKDDLQTQNEKKILSFEGEK